MRTDQDAIGVRSTYGGRARRDQLVDCAISELCERGFAGTTIGSVAQRAGVSKGVVTYHFPSKNDLLMAVVASLYERGGHQIAERVETAGNSLDALLAYIDANLEFVAAHVKHVRAVIEIAGSLRRPTGELALGTAEADPVAAHLRQLIETGLARGQFNAVNADVLAIVIRSAIDAAAARLSLDDTFDITDYSRGLRLLVRRAVEPSETHPGIVGTAR